MDWSPSALRLTVRPFLRAVIAAFPVVGFINRSLAALIGDEPTSAECVGSTILFLTKLILAVR